MITYPKRLIEVDLPIKRISFFARKEKDSRCGHIPRLHIYPAARPLAACRAVMCASLWPDPGDKNCPELFIKVAQEEMTQWAMKYIHLLSPESYRDFIRLQKEPIINIDADLLRTLLLDFIADFSNFDNSSNINFIRTSRLLTKIAHESLGNPKGTIPVLVDPFAGGGAIPLEGLRVGAESYASDTNPLALLINRVILRYAPKFGDRLADEIDSWGKTVNQDAESELSKYYPNVSEGITPIAYLWARTILSEAPESETYPVEVPLIRTMWLSKKGERTALRWVKDESGKVKTEVVEVLYANGNSTKVRRPILEIFLPKSSAEVPKGTVSRNSATCPVSGYTTPASNVQKQLIERQGGALDARLYCIVGVRSGRTGRVYSAPTHEQENAYQLALTDYISIKDKTENGLDIFPKEYLPIMSGVFNAPLYGHSTWGSLFNARQLLALNIYIKLARNRISKAIKDDQEFGTALAAVLGIAIDRLADLNASLCVWQLSTPNTAHVFGRWALPMIMDYGEVNPLAGAGGSPESAVWRISAALREINKGIQSQGEVMFASADQHPLPDDSADIFFTDPPYYNAIPYADLSDFFYVWLKRTIGDVFPDLFNTELTSKENEICEMSGWDPVRYSHKDKLFFEGKMTQATGHARRYLKPSGIGIVVFAHKTTTGWEAMLQSLIDAGWVITASWPIDTEMASRLRAKNSAALASSVHLVCRPRENSDGSLINMVGDWRDILQELPQRIHEWMPRLAQEGIVGADAIFACLGPALEIFSQFSTVEKANGEIVPLREYLEQIWAVVAKEAMNMIFTGSDASGFEEDARLTAMWLWTLFAGTSDNENSEDQSEQENDDDDDSSKSKKSSGGFSLEYDAARKIAQGLGAHLDKLRSLVEVKGDTARLLPVEERAVFLFGKDAGQVPEKKKKKESSPQLDLFKVLGIDDTTEKEWDVKSAAKIGETVLDRLHQSMILFAAGRGEALKRFLVEDGVGRDQRFWRLAQAFSALYPSSTDEKRWVDGVLARKKGLGF